ncbi:MAG: helix-turn-helix domain-containing protein [Candidatus Promineifilaceae bacterium]
MICWRNTSKRWRVAAAATSGLIPTSATIYQGQTALENLSPLETSLLTFLLAHPHTRHTYTAVIQAAWPAATNRAGVSNEALFQVITGLRRKIEPDPTRPCYLVNWRGIPEGGYQCFPEGKPG